MSAHAPSRWFACALLAGCNSCLWLPLHGQGDGQPGAVSAASKAELAPGRATRADVLCRLGAPEWHSPDGSRLVYATRDVHSVLIFYIVLDGAMLLFGEDLFDLCEFDAGGVLLSWRRVRRDFASQGSVADFDDSDIHKLFPG